VAGADLAAPEVGLQLRQVLAAAVNLHGEQGEGQLKISLGVKDQA
jgi:hypothetical protein